MSGEGSAVKGLLSAAAMTAVAAGLGGCGNGHSAEWKSGYTYGQGAAKEDFTGSLTGVAADDACNHALQAVPDGFGDPSNAGWVAGFTAGCEAQLRNH